MTCGPITDVHSGFLATTLNRTTFPISKLRRLLEDDLPGVGFEKMFLTTNELCCHNPRHPRQVHISVVSDQLEG